MKAVALLLCFVALAVASESEPRFQEVEMEAESSLHRPSMMSESGYAAFKREEADKAIAALHLDGEHESVLDMAIPHINTDDIDMLTAGAPETELISVAEETEAEDEAEDESEESDEAEDTMEEVEALDADIEADVDAAFVQIAAMESSNEFSEGESEDAAMESDAAENENGATEFSADADAAESSAGAEGEDQNEAHEFSADTADEEAAIDETASSAPVMDAEAEQTAAAAMIENESADTPVYDVDPKPLYGMAPQWNAVAPAFLEIADEDEAEAESEEESEDEDEAEEESEDAALLEVADEEADEEESEDEAEDEDEADEESEDESEEEAEEDVLLEADAAPAYVSPVLVPGRPNKYNDAMPDATYDKTAESALFPGWEKEARNQHLKAKLKGKGKKLSAKKRRGPRPAAKGKKSRKSRKARKSRRGGRKSRRGGKKARRSGRKSRRGGKKARRSGRKSRRGGRKARLSRKYRKGGRRYRLALKRNRARRAALKKNVGGIKAAQKKRDEDLKAQIIAAHDTLSVHDDHETKYPMDTSAEAAALKKKNCKKGDKKPNPAPMPVAVAVPAPAPQF